jgi:hypothetical protein
MIDWEVLLLLLAGTGVLIVLGVAVVLLHRRSTTQPPRIQYSKALPTWSALYLEALAQARTKPRRLSRSQWSFRPWNQGEQDQAPVQDDEPE